MTDVIVSNDLGTTQVKSICIYKVRPNQPHRIEYESVLGEVKELMTPDDDLMKVQTTHGEWFVGKSTEEHKCRNLIWGKGGLNWYLSPHYKAMHLYSIARHVGNTARSVDVDLVAALPRIDHKNRGAIKDYLEGSHFVDIPQREKFLTVNINNVLFAVQGWAAIMAEGINAGQQVAWLGLGGRNKTYATINKNGRVITDQTNSVEGGLLDAIDELANVIGRKYDVELPKQEWIKALQTKSITLADGKIDISEEAAKSIAPYIDASFSLIGDVWNEKTDMPLISDFRIGGGGALEIGHTIASRYKKARVVDDPRWTEAMGMMVLGRARFLNGT
jgi:hypothetical protein